jgi:hypothetical protein
MFPVLVTRVFTLIIRAIRDLFEGSIHLNDRFIEGEGGTSQEGKSSKEVELHVCARSNGSEDLGGGQVRSRL